MASDSLLKVIAGLVRRESRIAKEETKKAKEALKAEAEKDDEEEDEDEDPVGEPPPEEEPEKEAEPEDDGEGDSKPPGPDPTLVAQVAAIVKKEIEDEEKGKKETEVKLSGKKEKIDTKPKMEQRMGRMNFREAIRRSVTGTHLTEGYEQVVLGILEDEGVKGPLGYEPFFEKGKLFVMKGQERTAQKALKNSRDINKVPKIVGEEMEAEEYLAMEAVDVDGRCKGFKEALRRLTYEKIRQMKEKAKKEEVEIDEKFAGWIAFYNKDKLEIKKNEADSLYDAKLLAIKHFKVPKSKQGLLAIEPAQEEVEVDESNELQAIMALDDLGIEAEINKKGELTVKKKDLKKAEKALKKSFTKGGMPKLIGEDAEVEEGADKDTKGDKEAYQKFFKATLKKFGVDEPDQLKGDKKKEFFDAIDKGWKADNEKPEPGDKKEEVEVDEASLGSMLDKKAKKLGKKKKKVGEDAASFMAAASAAKRNGDKTFKFGDPEKEYPVTIKVDIPAKKEEVEIDEKKQKSKKVKGGKIIKKVTSTKAGYKMQGGKEVRMPPKEQKKRMKAGKKTARKIKGKRAAIQRKTAKSLKKRGSLGLGYVPGGSMIEKWKEAAFNKIRAIRSRLGEGIDAVASRELKLYIEQDRDLYRQQIVPIIKNVQRKMKSGKYDHAQAPKLWLYLVDNGAKKYVKEFGGDVKRDFPKDLRMSIANEFANEYKAEIEIHSGDML